MNVHKTQTTKMSNVVIEKYPYFLYEIKDQDQMNGRVVCKDFSVVSIIKMLHCLEHECESMTLFYLKSGFGMKQTFLKYVGLCINFGFIEKEKSMNGVKVCYRLKQKGRVFLEMFEQ